MRAPLRRIVPAVLLLLFGSYFAWDQVEQRALARDIDAIAARGEPTTVGDVAQGADTTERHDAARIYAAAAARVRAMPNDLTLRLPRLDVDSTVGPPLDLDELEQTYRADAPALQLVDQATPLDFNGWGDVAPDLAEGSLTTLFSLAALRADLLAARGKGDEAARALVRCVRLWRIMTPFSRYMVSQRLLGSVRILLRHASPEDAELRALLSELAALPDEDAMESQTLLQRARFIDDLFAPKRGLSDAILVRLLRPWVAHRQRIALASYEESLAVARAAWPRKFVMSRDLEQRYMPVFRAAQRPRFFSALAPPAAIGALSGPGATAAGRELAARRVIAATLAVERYRRQHAGALPPSLAELSPAYLAAVPIDPFSGDPLIYQTARDRYVVFSVDANLKNDGGAFYGFGTRGQMAPRQREPYDLGLLVAVRQ